MAQTDVGNREVYHDNKAYVGKWEEKIITEYEKLLSLLCFVNAFPKLNDESTPNILLNKVV